MLRAAIYTRISRDDADERLGVKRQEEDLRREAARRGAEVALLLVDNDLSGSGKVARPDYERLIEAISARTVDLVLAVDLDRLTRGLRDFVRLYEAAEEARITVAWLGGEANFATGIGIFEMELRASFAREELRKIRSRTRRKHQELAEHGQDAGGGRPFGYEPDRHTIREDEAESVREAARRVLAGEPLRAVCAAWNAEGRASVQGRRWAPSVLRRILTSGRISGRREYSTGENGQHRRRGPLTPAVWPGLISPEDSDRLRALLLPSGQPGRPARYLLTGGLLRCGICEKPLHTSTARSGQRRGYACVHGPGFSDGCGRVRINADPLERLLVGTVFQVADRGVLAQALQERAGAEDDGAGELARVQSSLGELARDYYERELITRPEYLAAREPLNARREVLGRRVEAARRRLDLPGDLDHLRLGWPGLTPDQQRTVLRLLIDRVTIRPATRRGPVFDPDRVEVCWYSWVMRALTVC